jgi:hypothetical protein
MMPLVCHTQMNRSIKTAMEPMDNMDWNTVVTTTWRRGINLMIQNMPALTVNNRIS